jgi:hypothetical protein
MFDLKGILHRVSQLEKLEAITKAVIDVNVGYRCVPGFKYDDYSYIIHSQDFKRRVADACEKAAREAIKEEIALIDDELNSVLDSIITKIADRVNNR